VHWQHCVNGSGSCILAFFTCLLGQTFYWRAPIGSAYWIAMISTGCLWESPQYAPACCGYWRFSIGTPAYCSVADRLQVTSSMLARAISTTGYWAWALGTGNMVLIWVQLVSSTGYWVFALGTERLVLIGHSCGAYWFAVTTMHF